jgi:hypothetical protein
MSALFEALVAGEIMSKEQAHLGFSRALESTADFALDIPNAKCLLDEFIQRAVASAILPSDFANSSS